MELDEVTTEGPTTERKEPGGEMYSSSLFDAIDRNDLQHFRLLIGVCECFNDLETLHNGSHTLLQYICLQKDRQEFADELLKLDISPNATGPRAKSTPFLLAAEHGHHLVLKMLLQNKETDLGAVDLYRCKEGALHKVVQMERGDGGHRDYVVCLDLLLDSICENDGHDDRRLNLNAVDGSGNTPLHCAATRLKEGGEIEEEIVLKLLRAGSDIAIQNNDGEPAFRRIPAELLETFMDECVTTNGKANFEKEFKITFRYKFLIPSSARPGSGTENFNHCVEEPLLLLSGSEEHRRLLKHPILASCIYLMWFRIRWIFFANFSIYAAYIFLMTLYILDLIQDGPHAQKPICCSSPLMPLLFFMLCVKEFTHIITSMGKYMSIPINRPKFVLILLSGFLLWVDVEKHVTSQIATLTILLMWIELALLLGQHPRFTTYMVMFKTVCINFFFFIAVYSMLVIAFALSFFILFHDEDMKMQVSQGDEYDYFADPWIGLMKTVLMMLGEFELSSLPFEASPFLSYVVFSAFLLLISVVLINLLNGLAVSDTQAIMEKAELVGYVSQIEMFSQMEAMMLDIPRLVHLFSCCFRRRILPCRLKPFKMVDLGFRGWTHVFWKWKKVEVMVNQGGLIQHCLSINCRPQCINCIMDKRVIKRAVKIASSSRKAKTIDDVWKRLDHIESLIKSIIVSVVQRD